jgi:hypothetical protein
MTPNAEFYKPTTEYADKLISQIGQTLLDRQANRRD